MVLKDKLFTWLLWLKKPSNTLWITPVFGAFAAILFVLLAASVNGLLPEAFILKVKPETLDALLSIIASSMLAVSTFSLSIMVSAFASASNNATPRATELVMGDDNTRVAIASFISAFVYAVIAKTALGIGYYQESGRFILFLGTLAVLAYLIYTLIRWVKTLSQLGRMNNTLNKIEQATANTLKAYRSSPFMGANRLRQAGFRHAIHARSSGYLTHINLPHLQAIAEHEDCRLEIMVRPGDLVYSGMVLAYLDKAPASLSDSICDAFVLEDGRSYAQDPKFGMVVLSEVAQRALSPAINDPGTAIKVLTILMRLLLDAKAETQVAESQEAEPLKYPRLAIVHMNEQDLVDHAFAPIARDGAAALEIQVHLQKILQIIATQAPEASVRQAARRQAEYSLQYAEQGLRLEQEKTKLKQLHQALFAPQ
ncbi:Uncharacterized membrane protein [Pasteurella testudinis DSM 23072]|uniref:Uncharacterized membrane protein n=1 Tax=Pasteurella testudinis DSM 23072 TaxID=1122938 RepID=A0A1W1V865_9PAST|nr:DUF2254 family protein [Pasteurella testudinis]SMB89231.1 Uncharacterized membrane protein [Pasteurella testudinis DSM 23072]SUB52959.1 membrane protein [Pasteurella testudinis]